MKPILFNTEMVKAILDGRKTVTRRVVKPQPSMTYCHKVGGEWFWTSKDADDDMMDWWPSYENGLRPPYRPGDVLYVREAFFKDNAGKYHYKADDGLPFFEKDIGHGLGWAFVRWRPSIHMPKEAARLFLRVKDVWVERLQDIDDIRAEEEGAEGAPCDCDGSEVFCSRCCNTGWITSPRSEFAGIWDSTIKPADRALYGWTANPWVWVIEFERVSKEDKHE